MTVHDQSTPVSVQPTNNVSGYEQYSSPVKPSYTPNEAAPTSLIFSTPSNKDAFFYGFFFVFYPVFMISMLVYVIVVSIEDAQSWYIIAFITTMSVSILVLVFLILPKRLEVWPKELKVIFFCGLSWRIPLSVICHVEQVPDCSLEFGIKLGTSITNRVRIDRIGRLNLVLTPKDVPGFIHHLRYAMSPASYIMPTQYSV